MFCIVVKDNELIRVGVCNGQRPDLTVITGPDTLTSLVKQWISHCWHQQPDYRPTFSGMRAIEYEHFFRDFRMLQLLFVNRL